jgi:hypothetical protein
MKKKFSTLFMAAGLVATTLFSSCSNDDDDNNNGGVTATKEYKLYNLSTGTAVEAGSVVFSQLADSTTAATVTLNSGYRNSGTTYSVNIITSATIGDYLYANLTSIDGGVGSSTTSPVRNASNNLAIKYSTIIGSTGYRIRVVNGNVVQATGTIQ